MIDLKAIRDRLNAATPGEWHSYANTVPVGYAKGNDVRVGLDNFICRDASCADMKFIANAKQDIAALIEAVEERDRALNKIRNTATLAVVNGGSEDTWRRVYGIVNDVLGPIKIGLRSDTLSAKDKGEENA